MARIITKEENELILQECLDEAMKALDQFENRKDRTKFKKWHEKWHKTLRFYTTLKDG